MAREKLKPLGFVRLRKSRLWYKDNGWWSVVTEFQPSSWSKGTYVNVSVSHFLYEQGSMSFHICNRLPGFASAEDDIDFDSKVENMATDAATLAVELLDKYKSIDEFITFYSKPDRRSVWDEYYSGIFKAIDGDFDEARSFFQKLSDNECQRSWEHAVQHRARELIFLLDDEQAFRNSIHGIVLRTRHLTALDDYKSGAIQIPWS